MRYFRVRNLRKFQRYTDRKPKWICIYLDMRASLDLEAIKRGIPSVTDADLWHAVSIFMLAATFDDPKQSSGHPPLPMDPVWIQRAASLDSAPDLDKLLSLCLLQEVGEPVTELGVSVTHRTGQDITTDDDARARDDFSDFMLANDRQVAMLRAKAEIAGVDLKAEVLRLGLEWPVVGAQVSGIKKHLVGLDQVEEPKLDMYDLATLDTFFDERDDDAIEHFARCSRYPELVRAEIARRREAM